MIVCRRQRWRGAPVSRRLVPAERKENLQMAARRTDLSRRRVAVESGRRAQLRPIGVIRSPLKTRAEAPKQGSEGAPDAWLEVSSFAARGLDGLAVGNEIVVVTWLHRARRD